MPRAPSPSPQPGSLRFLGRGHVLRCGALALVAGLTPGEVVGVAARTEPVALAQQPPGPGAVAFVALLASGEIARAALDAVPVAGAGSFRGLQLGEQADVAEAALQSGRAGRTDVV